MRDDVVEQLPLRRQFENYINRIGFVECVFETQDVGMADAHENGNLLLQTFVLGSLFHSRRLAEYFDGIALACRLLDAEMYRSEVTLSKLLPKVVLLPEGAGVSAFGIAEDEASLIQDRNLVPFLQLPPLVSPDYGFVDKGAVGREVLKDSDSITLLVFGEEQAMSIRYDRILYNNVCGRQPCLFSALGDNIS